MVFEGEEVVLKFEKYRNAGYLLFSFPFKGKAGMGMGWLHCYRLSPIPTLTLPLHPKGVSFGAR